jgi:hypothetical protein
MDIIRKRNTFALSGEIRNLISKLKYDNNPIKIKGSSMVGNLKYINDYDLYCDIKNKPEDPQEFLKKLNTIRYNATTQTPTFFISGIIFKDPENKYRWDTDQKVNNKIFNKLYKDAEFVKLDFVTFEKNKFIGIDMIYYLKPQKIDDETVLGTLREDVEKYMGEKRYFKVLKRLFGIYQIKKNEEGLKKLIEIFNSDLGKKYELFNQLEATQQLLDNPHFIKSETLKKRIQQNFKDLKIEIKEPKELPKFIEKLEKEIHNEAKKYIDEMSK